jgi:hypothetical protein
MHLSCRLSRLPPLAAPTCLPLLRSILHCTTVSVVAAQARTTAACVSWPPFSMPLFYMWPPAPMPRLMLLTASWVRAALPLRAAGRQCAAAESPPCGSPLFFRWHSRPYLGAAHGMIGEGNAC